MKGFAEYTFKHLILVQKSKTFSILHQLSIHQNKNHMCFTSPLITLALALMLELLIAQLGEVSLPTLNTGAYLLELLIAQFQEVSLPTLNTGAHLL